MPNLLSCPFCGEADVLIIEAEDDDGQFAAVGCNGCGAGSRQHYYCGEDAKEYAADAWNRRATLSDAPTEPVEAVNGELVEALRPFAAAAADADDGSVRGSATAWESPMAMAVTYGDFRRARAALRASAQKEAGNG